MNVARGGGGREEEAALVGGCGGGGGRRKRRRIRVVDVAPPPYQAWTAIPSRGLEWCSCAGCSWLLTRGNGHTEGEGSSHMEVH